jgi:hypothetical protein
MGTADLAPLPSALFWWAALAMAAIDLGLLLLVARCVRRPLFERLMWAVTAAAALTYAAIWGGVASWWMWDVVYFALFPAWARWWLPLWYGLGFGAVALLFWHVSVRLPGNPAVWFCLLGGLVSLPGHLWGMRRGLMRVPLLAEASPVAALTFGAFEFVAYWCFILALSLVLRRLGLLAGLWRH